MKGGGCVLHDDDPVENVREDQSLWDALGMVDVGSGSIHIKVNLETREWRLSIVDCERGRDGSKLQRNKTTKEACGLDYVLKRFGLC